MPDSFFIQTKIDHLTIDGRTYRAGSVVEVDKYRRKALVEHGHAVDNAGPASEPPVDADADAGADLDLNQTTRNRKVEKATRI